MRIAVIDIGTNVFGLLLGEVTNGKLKIISEFKVFSKIGKGGFVAGSLTDEAFINAEHAFGLIFKHIDDKGGADKVTGLATSAIRDAANGKDFVKQMEERFDFTIEVISGEREAELIYMAIRESFFIWNEKVLMMDIGGGSVEFIIAGKDTIFWKKSFPLGMLRLKEIFSPADPITSKDIELFEEYVGKELNTLFVEVERLNPTLMVGSSGSFDTFRDLLYPEVIGKRIGDREFIPSYELNIAKMRDLNDLLIHSTREQRMKMPGMSVMRVDLIVLASIFTQLILRKTGINELLQSAYSLKEGAMFEYLDNLKKI